MNPENVVGDVVSRGEEVVKSVVESTKSGVDNNKIPMNAGGITDDGEVDEDPIILRESNIEVTEPAETLFSLVDDNLDFNYGENVVEKVDNNEENMYDDNINGNDEEYENNDGVNDEDELSPLPKEYYDENGEDNSDDEIEEDIEDSEKESSLPKPTRPTKFSTVTTEICYGKDALTYERVKDEILGWEKEGEYKERMKKEVGHDPVQACKILLGYQKDYMLKDINGIAIRCNNVNKNRPLRIPAMKKYAQNFLYSGPGLPVEERAWQENGEVIIVGETGELIDGQNRCAGFMIAVQEWRRDQLDGGKLWGKIWPTQPTFSTIIVRGIKETQEVIQTIGTGIDRRYQDNLFTIDRFSDLNRHTKAKKARMLSKAVEFVAKRTGYVNTVYAIATKRERERLDEEGKGGGVLTNTQLANFLRNHPGLYDCVDDIFGEDGDNQLSNMKLSPGLCAGIYYLMSAGETNVAEYQAVRSEKAIDFSFREHARGFWIEFGKQAGSSLEKLRQAITYINGTDKDRGIFGSIQERVAVICHAWNSYISDLEVTEETVNLRYQHNVEFDETKQEYVFINPPTFSGIDCPAKSSSYEPTQTTIIEQTEIIKKAERESVELARLTIEKRSNKDDILDPNNSSNMADEIKKGLASSRANRMGLPQPATKFPKSTPPVVKSETDQPVSPITTKDAPSPPQTKQEASSPVKGPKLRGGV